jgi:hypothetical protein
MQTNLANEVEKQVQWMNLSGQLHTVFILGKRDHSVSQMGGLEVPRA